MTDAAAARDRILDALRLDLVGPRPGERGHAAYTAEILPVAPSKWYLTGFLVPHEAPADQRSDDDSDDAWTRLTVRWRVTTTTPRRPPQRAKRSSRLRWGFRCWCPTTRLSFRWLALNHS